MKTAGFVKIFVIITYLVMVSVNVLANTLPINGNNTGQVSNAYPNLFAPAPVTFSIWGLIYLLLAIYAAYQFFILGKSKPSQNLKFIQKIGLNFSISSLANVGWIFAWHYHQIGLSLLFMLVILVNLIRIANLINHQKLSKIEVFSIKAPFSIYFGWITVATIANIVTLLVSLNWAGFGWLDQTWMVLVLITGAGIGMWRTLKDSNNFYGLVLIWAYLGILMRHTSMSGFNNQYPVVINTLVACLIVFVGINSWVFLKKQP